MSRLYEYGRRIDRKNEKKRKFKAVMYVVLFTFLLSTGFICGEMLSKRGTAKAKAASTKQYNSVIPLKESKMPEDKSGASDKAGVADQRETKVPDNPSAQSDNTNPYKPDGQKTAYITFDDGPSSEVTPKILDILDSSNIKATFFVVGSMAEINKDILLREWKDGQSIGNHSYSHKYKELYSNPSNFINDINKCDNVIKSIIGNDYNVKLLRFPGGSFGTKLKPFREEALKDGYHYVDWNALNGDAESNSGTVDKLIQRLKETTIGKQHVVILMHDAPMKQVTVQALPQIIDYLKQQGYIFKTLH